ncbi:predicted protein [Naegleria gruberi]|uniref:Predicted protein n=1 Tax=Naegleria gruberi TaxID=5762 RepID=D2VWG8_NAEGR|nr:uncharacterized protein NAEGRDRAFT_81481 [Naegleria gruberi]EFC38894.1 predicted protein [Naegleria gruberi]|eukprot:XP_002671638.1 predicted protein [Naegleria gruberi strain NEG-M]
MSQVITNIDSESSKGEIAETSFHQQQQHQQRNESLLSSENNNNENSSSSSSTTSTAEQTSTMNSENKINSSSSAATQGPPPSRGRGGRSGTILRGTAPFLSTTTTLENSNTSPSTTIEQPSTTSSSATEQPISTSTSAETIVTSVDNVQTNPTNSGDESKPAATILDVINDDEALFKLAQERNRNRKRGNPRTAQRHDSQASKIEENDWLTAGYCEFQGTRPSMEDALYCNMSFRSFTSDMGVLNETCIGLFDGHGGSKASKQASEILHSVFLDKLTKYENLLTRYFEDYNSRALIREEAKSLTKLLRKHFMEKEAEQKLSEERAVEQFDILRMSSVDAIQIIIRESFLEADELVCEQNSVDGSTATLVYMPTRDSKFLFVGNVGDSRVVLCRDGKPITLTVDHRPSDSDERRRVRDAGKSIINNRISACLAVSRSIGDKTFHPGVISDPHTQAIRLCEKDEFMIIACDGVFDFVSEEEAVREIRDETNPITASTKLRDYAFNKKGSNDNISAIVVRFKRP